MVLAFRVSQGLGGSSQYGLPFGASFRSDAGARDSLDRLRTAAVLIFVLVLCLCVRVIAFRVLSLSRMNQYSSSFGGEAIKNIKPKKKHLRKYCLHVCACVCVQQLLEIRLETLTHAPFRNGARRRKISTSV